jgi:hypothetical protein
VRCYRGAASGAKPLACGVALCEDYTNLALAAFAIAFGGRPHDYEGAGTALLHGTCIPSSGVSHMDLKAEERLHSPIRVKRVWFLLPASFALFSLMVSGQEDGGGKSEYGWV